MSAWIEHVKTYAKENNMKYKDALKEASKTYTKPNTGEGKLKKTQTIKNSVEKESVNNENEVLPEPAFPIINTE